MNQPHKREVVGFEVGFIYELGQRVLVCLQMDWQKMQATFKIFKTVEEAQAYYSMERDK